MEYRVGAGEVVLWGWGPCGRPWQVGVNIPHLRGYQDTTGTT